MMIPIVFCASFVPCVRATNPPETSWSRRKTRLTVPGLRRRMIHVTASISVAAIAIPRKGASSEGTSTLSFSPPHLTTSKPAAATAEPRMPPIRAWLELEGSARYQVTRFHVIAPTRPARITSGVTTLCSTIPFAIVAATAKEMNAPAKFRIAALISSGPWRHGPRRHARGDRVRRIVEAVGEVEEEGNRDDGDEREVVHRASYAFLTTMFAITFAALSVASIARSSPS